MPGDDPRIGALAAHYRSEAASYAELWAPVLLGPARQLLQELGLGGEERVLDAGSGCGLLLAEVQRRFPRTRTMGVDLAPEALALGPAVAWRASMDLRRLALLPGTFDVAILAFVLFHLPEPAEALREIERILRPGGVVATATWGSAPAFAGDTAWNEELDAAGAAPDPGIFAQHQLVDSEAKMEALLRRAGFHRIRTWCGPLHFRYEVEHYVRLRTEHGRARRRLASLPAERRLACVDRARRRFEGMPPGDRVDRTPVVYAVASLAPPR